MVKVAVVFLFLLVTIKSGGQETLDSLINHKQYLSAYEYLVELDLGNTKPDVVLNKIDLCLYYYLDSEYHRQFSFVDLREGEELDVLRKQNQHGETPHEFLIDSVLLRLIDDYPTDYRLHKSLGQYYNQIYYDFGDRWGERSEVLLEKSHYYYLQAFEHGVYDYYSLYALGYFQTLFENYFEAQNWYLKSLKLRPNEPLTNYNLAITYLFDGLPKKGIQYSEIAYEMFVDSLKKGDAARITGILYSKIEEQQQALFYFEKANALSPNYRPNQMYLLKSYLALDKDSIAVELGYQVLVGALHVPELAEEYIELFGQLGKQEQLHQVFDKVLEEHRADAEACGNICFHYGKLLFREGEKRKSKQMIKQSQTHFLKVFDQNHQVFEAIDVMLEMLAKGAK